MKKSLLSLALTLFLYNGDLSAQVKKVQAKAPLKKATSSTIDMKASLLRGKGIYGTYCISCHQADGGGVPNLNAPIIKTSYVLGNKTQLINILLKGMQGVDIEGESYSNVMPAANYLTNQQAADVLTYIRNNFGNKASAVTLADVKAVRK